MKKQIFESHLKKEEEEQNKKEKKIEEWNKRLEERGEKWNEKLKEILKEKDITQSKFVKELNDNYDTNFTQAMISEWLRIGETARKSDGTERKIRFPVYKNMAIIADFLGVDVGYLTGETNMETFTIEKVSNYTNLSEKAINSILKITGTTHSCIDWGDESEKYKRVLNKLLESSKFIELIKALGDMEDIYAEKEKTQQPLERLYQELGSELFDVACKYSGFCAEELEGLNLTREEINAIHLFDKAQDECYSLCQKNEYDIKAYNYNTYKAFDILMNQLYPNEK